MFHETRSGKDLRILALGDVRDAPMLIEEDRARAGRPLIERHDVASHESLPPYSLFLAPGMFRRCAVGHHASIRLAWGSSEQSGALLGLGRSSASMSWMGLRPA